MTQRGRSDSASQNDRVLAQLRKGPLDAVDFQPPNVCDGGKPEVAGPNPSGLCLCGCGGRTTIAVHNHTEKGYVKGQPRRFLPGHNAPVRPKTPLVCAGCGVELPPPERYGRLRKWCSDACRRAVPPPLSDHECECGCGHLTPIASRSRPDCGWVKGEPQPFITGHQRRHHTRIRQLAALNRFEVRDCGYETPCWVWLAQTDPKGYGHTFIDGRLETAYRAVYEQHRGPVPRTLDLHHLCENPSCVNPEHLEVLTRSEHLLRHSRKRAAA